MNLEKSVKYMQWRLSKTGTEKDKEHFDNITEHLNKYIYQKSNDHNLFVKLFLTILVNQMSINPYGGQKSWVSVIRTFLGIPLNDHIKNFTDAHNLNQYAFILDLYGIEGATYPTTRKDLNKLSKDNKELFEKNKDKILAKFKEEAKMTPEEGYIIIKTLVAEIIADYELKP